MEERSGRYQSLKRALEQEGTRLCTMVQNALLFGCTMSLSLEIRGPGFSLDSAIHSCVTLGANYFIFVISHFVCPHLCGVSRRYNVCKGAL